MTFKTACCVAAILSIACSSVLSAQGKKVDAVPLPTNRPPLVKKVVAKCLAKYELYYGRLGPEVQMSLPAPLLANGSGGRQYFEFSSSRQDNPASVTCYYKSVTVTLPTFYQDLYWFNCKNAIKQAEDTWTCEV